MIVVIAVIAMIAIGALIAYLADGFWTCAFDPRKVRISPQQRQPRKVKPLCRRLRSTTTRSRATLCRPDRARLIGSIPLRFPSRSVSPASRRSWSPWWARTGSATGARPTPSQSARTVPRLPQRDRTVFVSGTPPPWGGPLGAAVKALAFIAAPAGPQLAIGTDRFYLTGRRNGAFEDGEIIIVPQAMIHTIAGSAAGTRLAIAGDAGRVEVWDVHGPKAVAVLKPAWPTVVSSQGCALTADGQWLAYLVTEDVVRVVDVSGPGAAEVGRLGQDVAIAALAFAPTGRRLAIAGWDGTVTLWDLAGAAPVKQATIAAAGKPVCVRFSPAGTSRSARMMCSCGTSA